jgi:rhodanese-related sulfurtransferase
MYKMIFLLGLFSLISFSNESAIPLLSTGIETDYRDPKGDTMHIIVKREVDPACKNIQITNDMFWEEQYASHEVSNACKSTFITSAGQIIFPMKLHKDIETYGELEVLSYIQKMQNDPSMFFVDTRDEEWYEYRTIPGADNMHYVYITMPDVFPEEYEASLVKLGIIMRKDKTYDFSAAKTVLFFCNGAWCSQSPKMIKGLLSLGYPAEKIKWYRGGMQTWLAAGMTSTRKK